MKHQIRELPATELLRISVDRALRQIRSRSSEIHEDLQDAAKALGALPLTSSEYVQAINALRNCHAYACRSEWGAARYELVALDRRLPTLLGETVRSRDCDGGLAARSAAPRNPSPAAVGSVHAR